MSESIRSNLLLVNPSASAADMRAACRTAGALEFVDGLPDGLDTVLGRSGDTLIRGPEAASLHRPRVDPPYPDPHPRRTHGGAGPAHRARTRAVPAQGGRGTPRPWSSRTVCRRSGAPTGSCSSRTGKSGASAVTMNSWRTRKAAIAGSLSCRGGRLIRLMGTPSPPSKMTIEDIARDMADKAGGIDPLGKTLLFCLDDEQMLIDGTGSTNVVSVVLGAGCRGRLHGAHVHRNLRPTSAQGDQAIHGRGVGEDQGQRRHVDRRQVEEADLSPCSGARAIR